MRTSPRIPPPLQPRSSIVWRMCYLSLISTYVAAHSRKRSCSLAFPPAQPSSRHRNHQPEATSSPRINRRRSLTRCYRKVLLYTMPHELYPSVVQ